MIKNIVIARYIGTFPNALRPKISWKIRVFETDGAPEVIREGLKKGYVCSRDLPVNTTLREPLEIMLFRQLPAKDQFEVLKQCDDKEVFLRAASKRVKHRIIRWLTQ